LRDDTGNRRFIPIQVGELDFDAIKKDREHLLAEAYSAYRNEMVLTLELEGEALTHSKTMQAARMVKDDADVMADQFTEWLTSKENVENSENFDVEKFRILPLFGGMGPWHGWRADARHTQLAAKALRSLGYASRKIKGFYHWRHQGGGVGGDGF
jgi:predicted P-loop ATPase